MQVPPEPSSSVSQVIDGIILLTAVVISFSAACTWVLVSSKEGRALSCSRAFAASVDGVGSYGWDTWHPDVASAMTAMAVDRRRLRTGRVCCFISRCSVSADRLESCDHRGDVVAAGAGLAIVALLGVLAVCMRPTHTFQAAAVGQCGGTGGQVREVGVSGWVGAEVAQLGVCVRSDDRDALGDGPQLIHLLDGVVGGFHGVNVARLQVQLGRRGGFDTG